MSAEERLAQLAVLAGVLPGYRDVWGKPREIPPETIRAVLGAMGLGAEGSAAVEDSIAALEAEAWRPLLPPVVVLREGAADFVVALTVPERLDAGRVLWSIAAEDGAARDGMVAIDVLAELARRGNRRRLALPLARDLPLGYHALRVEVGEESAETALIVVPARCYLPPDLAEGRRCWGLTTQVYGLRSARNWGMGDFGDLGRLAETAAGQGARALGINPLHALFPIEPRHISPYSPSSRLFLNPLYIDVAAVPDFAGCAAAQALVAGPGFAAALAQARATAEIDHPAVAALKGPVLAVLHDAFAAAHLGGGPTGALTERGAAFRRFQAAGGAMLQAYAVFNVLQRHALATGQGFCWRDWPEGLRDPQSPAVEAFAAAHPLEVEREQYLEWEADRQLAAAAARGAQAGLGIGFYRDIAVGVDRNGAEAWAAPAMLAAGASVGAPPDLVNRKGQDWGFAPFNPVELRRRSYAPYVAALRANMRHAGVLRIDHVMVLKQLYWIPRGAAAAAGAYVAYPFEDLLGILALESERQRCAVVGEDLGTVPEGFRERLAAAGVLSYRVMLFEREADGSFLAPEAYPRLAAATFATHDIPTLKGFWLGRDLEWRERLDLYPDHEAAAQDRVDRRRERQQLVAALVAQGVLAAAEVPALGADGDAPVYTLALAEAVHGFLGRTNACLALLQLEDAAGEIEQANLPGTVDQHPNWRRKLSRTLEELAGDASFAAIAGALQTARVR